MQLPALITETAVLASSLKDEGFTIIATCPGWVATDMGSGSNDVRSYLLRYLLIWRLCPCLLRLCVPSLKRGF